MVSFQNLKLKEDTPIYLQIINHIKSGIIGNIIENGDEMPSRRTVSSLLAVNPNTIQKAYKLLEDEKLIISHTGAKSVITVTESQRKQLKKEVLEKDMLELIRRVQATGIEKKEALALLEQLWEVTLDETDI